MSTENKNMPRLRFPGFTGEWEEKKLGEVANSFSGGTPRVGEPRYYGGNIPFIRSGEIYDSKTSLFITEEGLNNSTARLVNKGDLLIALYGATSGNVAISKINGAINQAILCVRSQKVNINFLCNYLAYQKDNITNRFLQGGQGNLSSDIIMSLNILFPTLAEQQKIAECLTAIDDLIVAQGKKVDALKEHKKGLMQQLFPQPGETTPRFRFPGFTGEWVEKKINEIFDFRQGFQCPIDLQSMHQKEGYVRFIRIIDLTQTTEPPRYIENPGLGYYVNKDDLFMVRYGSPGLVGYGYEGVIANNLFKLLPKVDMCTKLYKYILTYLYADIVALCPINVLPAINFTSLGCLRISFPPSLAEQQKIAECLSELDALIADEAKQLDALKEHKKGLMQQLFPQPTK